ncbi:SDR family NAD(P)-dependent oxidoreductase, partial [Streptomyces sp. AC550_RSS872]|uniref:SDR family NAD(P)-dependent oxidoreductase n=1 Tax=Streptomyces sp. AC550_RSS872 TaxID=2823689 RepID=UPI001C25DA7D
GTTPNWTTYHPPHTHHHIPLPTHPLNPKHHWIDTATPQTAAPRATPGPHPLLDSLLVRSMDQCVFLTEFAVDRHWVLSEHKLLGEAIVPGTTYLDMGRAAAETLLGRPATEIRDVTFLVPLLVQEGTSRTVHTTVREASDGLATFTVASHDPRDDTWTLHVQGTVSVRPHPEKPRQRDVAALRAECALDTVDTAAHQAEHRTMEFGHRWQGSLRTVRVGVRRALGELDLPEEYASECRDHVLHPALLDLATGFHGFAVLRSADDSLRAREDRGFFLPVGYDSLRIHTALPRRGISHVRPHADHGGDGEVRKTNVLICDESGAVAVEITGFTVKRVTDARRTVAQLRPHARHHALRWIQAPAPTGTPAAVHRVLLVGEDHGMAGQLGEALRAHGVDVAEATLADSWSAVDAGRYRVPPEPDGFVRLLDALGGPVFDEVVYVAGPVNPRLHDEPAVFDAHLSRGVHSLFHLLQCLSGRGAMPDRLSVVAPSVARVTGRESATEAVHATLFGLAKVAALENDGLGVLCVDVCGDTGADAVCAELLGVRTLAAVALRDGVRHVAQLVPVQLKKDPDIPQVRAGDVFLITGGLGGLGLAVARHLSRTVPGVRLALVGRTEMPPQERWDEVSDPALRRRIGILRELADSGAKVRTYSADVVDLARMTEIVPLIRSELGAVDYVVHAAGVAGDGFLFRKDPETFRRTLAPKVLGAAVLDLVTRDAPPKLMVNFGSTVSVFGAAGQGDYTAANSYLDHFADERSARGRRTVTIGWSDWLDVGMAFDHGVPRDQGFFRSLPVEEALSSFEEILASSGRSVIVGEINSPRLARADSPLAALVDRGHVVLSEPIRRAAAFAQDSPVPPADTARSGDDAARLRLLGKKEDTYTGTERTLAHIWATELGLAELNVHDSSFALGVDSLAALRLAQRIQKLMQVRVSMADLYTYETVAKLAKHLDREGAGAMDGSLS